MAEASANPLPLKRTLLEIGTGVALGFIFATLLGPRFLSWWYEPPSKLAISCGPSVESALGQFVVVQLVSAALGGVLVWLLLFYVRRMWKKRAQAAQPS
ncbi:MAG: hypothetical protein QM756_40445 [Polyangiaceae bacterium]